MHVFVLIMTYVSLLGGGAHVETNARIFDNLKSCVAAGDHVPSQMAKTLNKDYAYVCVEEVVEH